MSTQWVSLTTKFTPGWPWPEDSYGMDPRFGADGWCRGCGTPFHEQTGPLTIQGSKFPTSPVWMPNWSFDVVCVSAEVAAEVVGRFDVRLRPVHKPHQGPTDTMQILPAVTQRDWYDSAALSLAVRERHRRFSGEQTGSACVVCGRWKWLPVSEEDAPIRASSLDGTFGDVLASPEDFGDGLKSFKQLLFSRPLGEFLASAHPKSWSVVDITTTSTGTGSA